MPEKGNAQIPVADDERKNVHREANNAVFPANKVHAVGSLKTVNLEIEYWEKSPYQETWDEDGGESHRTLQCSWADARLFPEAMLGDVQRVGPNSVFFNRTLPEPHPHGTKNLWAVAISLKNGYGAWTKDPQTGLIQFTDLVNSLDGMAEWDVTYRNLPYDVIPNGQMRDNIKAERLRYVSTPFKLSSESYQLPGNLYVFSQSLRPIPEGTSKHIPLTELRYTWHKVPEPLPQVVTSGEAFGKVNRAFFDGYGPGQLLCELPEISEKKWTPRGTPFRNITYVFKARKSGWNSLFERNQGGFRAVVLRRDVRLAAIQRGDPISIYDTFNFDVLFHANA